MLRRDWVDWALFVAQIASALGAGAAVWFAALTIKAAKSQAKASQDALIRERRIDFELGVLRELASFNLRDDHVMWAAEEFKVLAALLPSHLAPIARAAVGLSSTDEGTAIARDAMGSGSGTARARLKSAIESEILAAITRLLHERN